MAQSTLAEAIQLILNAIFRSRRYCFGPQDQLEALKSEGPSARIFMSYCSHLQLLQTLATSGLHSNQRYGRLAVGCTCVDKIQVASLIVIWQIPSPE
jgi:hypothetical protein